MKHHKECLKDADQCHTYNKQQWLHTDNHGKVQSPFLLRQFIPGSFILCNYKRC